MIQTLYVCVFEQLQSLTQIYWDFYFANLFHTQLLIFNRQFVPSLLECQLKFNQNTLN